MVWGPLIAGGLSLVSGLGARQSAKSQQKRQAANDMIANQVNEARIAEKNRRNLELGKALLKTKETTREQINETRTETTALDNYSYVDVDGMMDAAERAGFNPVTWLNAGGMQAYTQTGTRGVTESTYKADNTTTRRGHNAAAAYALMSPESALMTASQATNIPSIAEAVGNAGKAAFDVYRQDAARQQSQDFQRELLGLQLDAIQRNRGSGVTGGTQVGNGTPSYSTNGSTVTRGGSASSGGGLSMHSAPISGPILKAGDPAEATNPWSAFNGRVNMRMPDAGGAFSDRYGEAGEMIYGLGLMGIDAWENLPPQWKVGITTRPPARTEPAPYERTWEWIKKNIGKNYTGSSDDFFRVGN